MFGDIVGAIFLDERHVIEKESRSPNASEIHLDQHQANLKLREFTTHAPWACED